MKDKETIMHHGRLIREKCESMNLADVEEAHKAWRIFEKELNSYQIEEEREFFKIGFFFGDEEGLKEFIDTQGLPDERPIHRA